MQYPQPLAEGKFLKRYKRFFADVETQTGTITCYVPNTGSLKGTAIADSPCRFSQDTSGQRKLPYTLEMISPPEQGWTGINTAIPNKIVEEGLQQRLLPHWKAFADYQREVKINSGTRIDFVMSRKPLNGRLKPENFLGPGEGLHLVEVKNCNMVEGELALFPDAVTTRGQKHLIEMMELMDQGFTAEIVFTVQNEQATDFAPAYDIDPEYGVLLEEAQAKGMIISPLRCQLGTQEVRLTDRRLTLKL